MASAKHGYPHVAALFQDDIDRRATPAAQPSRDESQWTQLVATLDDELLARVERVERLTRDDRRGRRPGAGRRAAFPARPVLPSAEFRSAGAARAQDRRTDRPTRRC